MKKRKFKEENLWDANFKTKCLSSVISVIVGVAIVVLSIRTIIVNFDTSVYLGGTSSLERKNTYKITP